MKKNKEESPLF